MQAKLLGVVAVGAVAIGGGLYAWDKGYWGDQDPSPDTCAPVPSATSDQLRCTRLIQLDDRAIGPLTLHPDGSIVAVTRAGAPDVDDPIMLIALSQQNGTVRRRVAVQGIAPTSAVMSVAVNQKGTQFALGLGNQPMRSFAMDTGAVLRSIPYSNIRQSVFADDGALVIDPGHYASGIPAPGDAHVFDLRPATPVERARMSEDTHGLYRSSATLSVSPDGRYFARRPDDDDADRQVSIQIGRVEAPDHVERTLTAKLPTRCSYTLTALTFSSTGARIAAAFDCNRRWGGRTAALVIWDLMTGDDIAVFPSHWGWHDVVWLTNDRLVATRFNPDRAVGALYRFDLNSGR